MPCAQTRIWSDAPNACLLVTCLGMGHRHSSTEPGLRLMAQVALHRCKEGGLTEATPWDEGEGRASATTPKIHTFSNVSSAWLKATSASMDPRRGLL